MRLFSDVCREGSFSWPQDQRDRGTRRRGLDLAWCTARSERRWTAAWNGPEGFRLLDRGRDVGAGVPEPILSNDLFGKTRGSVGSAIFD
jgi:hypothetical protein